MQLGFIEKMSGPGHVRVSGRDNIGEHFQISDGFKSTWPFALSDCILLGSGGALLIRAVTHNSGSVGLSCPIRVNMPHITDIYRQSDLYGPWRYWKSTAKRRGGGGGGKLCGSPRALVSFADIHTYEPNTSISRSLCLKSSGKFLIPIGWKPSGALEKPAP